VLLRSIGAIVEKHEHNVGPDLGDRLDAARRRLDGLQPMKTKSRFADALEAIAEPSSGEQQPTSKIGYLR
jgi:hypothetical protein